MKHTDFDLKPIDATGLDFSNLLYPVANLLRYGLRNRLKTQVQEKYKHKKIYISYYPIFIYTLASVIFTPFYAHARARRQYVLIPPSNTNTTGAVAGIK